MKIRPSPTKGRPTGPGMAEVRERKRGFLQRDQARPPGWTRRQTRERKKRRDNEVRERGEVKERRESEVSMDSDGVILFFIFLGWCLILWVWWK